MSRNPPTPPPAEQPQQPPPPPPWLVNILTLRSNCQNHRVNYEKTNEDIVSILIGEVEKSKQENAYLLDLATKLDKELKELKKKHPEEKPPGDEKLPGRPATPKEITKGDKALGENAPTPVPKDGPKPPPAEAGIVKKPEPEPSIPA